MSHQIIHPLQLRALPSDVVRQLIRAREFMDDCYAEKINVEHAASAAYLSPFHFSRVFKQTYHLTPHQYLTYRRIEKAKDLLRRTDKSVTEVCYEIGFDSLASFSLLFQRRIGTSPSLFRRRAMIYLSDCHRIPEWAVPHCFLFAFPEDSRIR
jgi:AraC-like DNA-binding protein